MKKMITALGAAILVQLASPAVQAQEGQLVLEEILVTASRRVESLQEVAMSVSAFSSDFFPKRWRQRPRWVGAVHT